MKTLKELQEAMQSYVLEADARVADDIVKPANMDAEARLHVYRNAYYLRLIEVLEGDYSVLYKMMGKEVFDAMVRDYLDTFPPEHFSVKQVGKNLPTFLKNIEDCDPSYSELAEFEWSLNVALFAKDVTPLTVEDLSKIPPEEWSDLHLQLHPSVHLFEARFNTAERWQSVNSDKGDIESICLPEPCYYLIWRRDQESYFCPLSREQSYLIRALEKGESFGALCETMLAHFDEDQVVQWVATALQTWLVEEVFRSR